MNSNNLSPFDYISEQIKVFVVNRLAQDPATIQQLADTFALLVDDLAISEKSLDYVLDALIKQKIVSFEYTHGVKDYYLRKFVGDNIFKLNLEEVERLIVENDVPFYEKKKPTLEDDLYFETIDGKITIQINRPIIVEELVEDEPNQELLNNNVETSASESINAGELTNDQEVANEQQVEIIEEPAKEQVTQNEVERDVSIDEEREVKDNKDIEIKLDLNQEQEISWEQVVDNQYNDNQPIAEDYTCDSPIQDDSDYENALNEEHSSVDNSIINDEYSLDTNNEKTEENTNFDELDTSANEKIFSANDDEEQSIIEQSFEENIEPYNEDDIAISEENNFENEIQKSPIFGHEYNQNEVSADSENVDQSSYTVFGNNESDELIMKIFGNHFVEASKRQEEKSDKNSADNPIEEPIEKTVDNSKNDSTLKDTASEVSTNEEIAQKETPIVNSTSSDSDDTRTTKRINADDIVFTSNYVYESTQISREEEQQRIDNALKKLNEYLQKPQPKEEVVQEEQPEIEEKIETVVPTISREEEQQRIENALKKLSEYSQKPAPKVEEVHEEKVEEEPLKQETEPEQNEEPTLQKNVLSVANYIREQEVINSYDWERKLTRCFIDCHVEEEDESNNAQDNVIVSTYAELKDIMEKKNYKFKPYSNYDSVSFYSDNYVFSNRLARDTSIYTYLFLLLEIFIGYFFVDKFVNKGIVPYIILAVCLLIIPIIFVLKYFLFKDKRKPANFYFSISIVTALMIYVNLMVMVVLLAFFIPSLNVSVTNLSSMITTVFYPAGLFLAIPFSVCVYSILYHSKKYHLH